MKSYATVSLVLLVIIWLYYALLESSPLQASVGKILMGIKVVDRRGRRLSFWQATERIVSKLVTNVTFYFGFFVAAWDKKKRTLHDRISHSAVILKSAEFDPDAIEEEEDEDKCQCQSTVVVLRFHSNMVFICFILTYSLYMVSPAVFRIRRSRAHSFRGRLLSPFRTSPGIW